MTRRNTLILSCASAAIVLLVGWMMYQSMYVGPRGKLTDRLGTLNSTISRQSDELAKLRNVSKELKHQASTTLGATYDVVDHRLRTLLTTIARENGLTGCSASSQSPKTRTNPGSEAKGSKGLARMLDKQIDFAVVSASFEAQGSLESVLRTVEVIRAQPWAHRVDSVDIRPVSIERKAFAVSVGLQTVMMPDMVGNDHPMPELVALDAEQTARVVRVAATSPFLLPPPKPEPNQADAPRPARDDRPKQVDPEERFRVWRVTGVVRRPGPVMEVWLVNTKNNNSAVLEVGQKVAGATLVDASAGVAVFEVDGARYDVRVGQSVAERSPHDD